MNLRYMTMSLIAATLLAAGCTTENPVTPNLAAVTVEDTFVTMSDKGGEEIFTFAAADEWTVKVNYYQGDKLDPAEVDWLTVSPLEGSAGDVTLKLSADAAPLDRKAGIEIVCGGKSQLIAVAQPGDPSLKPTYPEFEAGDYWIMLQEGETWKYALPLSGKPYGYLNVSAATVDGDKISAPASAVFTFTAVEGGFTMQDAEGQYYYQDDSHDSFNVQSDLPGSGHVWKVEQTGDSEFRIENVARSKWMQYDTGYSSFGSYGSAKEGAILPFLVKASDSGEPEPEPSGDEVLTMSEIFSEDTELSDGQSYTWGGLNVTYEKHNTTGASKFVVSDPGFRFYQEDVLTFDAGSKKMVKVVFSDINNGKNGPVAADCGEVDETGLSWTGEASKIVFTATKQVRFNTITITYKGE